MPIKLIKNYKLRDEEYIISASDNSDAKHYKVFYKGKELKDVTAIVRIKRGEWIIIVQKWFGGKCQSLGYGDVIIKKY